MRKICLTLSCLLLYIFCFSPAIFSFTDDMYIWSGGMDSILTSSSVDTNSTPVDLALESQSAILIEQNTRKSFI